MMSKEEFESYVEEYLERKEQEQEEDEGEHQSPLATPLKIGSFFLLCGITLGLSYAATTAVLTIMRSL